MDTQTTDTARTVCLNTLLSGDTFREKGDGQQRVYGPVDYVQTYGDEFATVYFQDGTVWADGRNVHGWLKVELVHRNPDCEHGVHPDLCWDGCWAL